MGQVGTRVFRWNGVTEDFQEECYNVPDIVQDEFQAVQGQIAWVARRGQCHGHGNFSGRFSLNF